MKKKLNRMFLIMMFVSCSPSLEYLDTDKIEEGIYLETYVSAGGAIGSDYWYYYLTDSINFRKFIGNCNEIENYEIKIVSNKIIVDKYERYSVSYAKSQGVNIKQSVKVKTDSTVYSVSELKRLKVNDR